MVYADNLVVGARGKIATVRGEADGVDCAEVVAHVAELARLGVGEVVGLVYGLGGPDPDMAICAASGICLGKEKRRGAHTTAGRCEPRAVRGDMAAVNLKVLLFACRNRPKTSVSVGITCISVLKVCSPLWLSQAGLISCIIGVLLGLWAVMGLHCQRQRAGT